MAGQKKRKVLLKSAILQRIETRTITLAQWNAKSKINIAPWAKFVYKYYDKLRHVKTGKQQILG